TRSTFAMDVLAPAFAPIRPHVPGKGTGDLVEFPLAVTPWLRLPVYHTFAYFVPAPLFRRNLRALLRSDLPVLYEFHAVDLLDLGLDQVDPRMARHPGMRESLDSKRVRFRDILRIIAAERPVRPSRDPLEAGLA